MRLGGWNATLALLVAITMALSLAPDRTREPRAEGPPLVPARALERVALLRVERRQPGAGEPDYVVLRRTPRVGEEGAVFGPPVAPLAPSNSIPAPSAAGEAGATDSALAPGESDWILPGAFDHPADARRVEELLTRLRAIDAVDRVATNQSSHASYGLGPESTRLFAYDEEGTPLFELLQGVPSAASEAAAETGEQPASTAQDAATSLAAEASPRGGSWFRRAGDADVYRARRIEGVRARSEDWLDTRLLELETTDVVALAVQGELELDARRLAWDRWETADGRALALDSLRRFLFELASARLHSVVGRATELAQPVSPSGQAGSESGTTAGGPPGLKLRLELEAGERVELRIWPGAEGERHNVHVEGRAWVVSIDARTYDLLLARLRSLS